MDEVTVVAGIPIPSASPWFLGGVAIHVATGIVCVVAGIGAMPSGKRHGRHSRFGTVHFWFLLGVFVTARALAVVRWSEDYHIGMATSYVLLLTAFYVDNGKSLPLWRLLPTIVYWLGPAAVALPLVAYTLLRHRLLRPPQ